MKTASVRPNFLVIGAPRCGTTSLHDILGQHPDIFMSAVKEPHYFSSFDFPFPENDILQVTKDKATYESFFAEAGDKLCGESSSYYLADPKAPAKIKAYNPDMKLIAIVREPVSRAYSHYLLYDRRGKQEFSFRDTIELQLKDKPDVPDVYNLVELGRYEHQLANYYKHFPKEQILVVLFDDFTKRQVETIERILTFLEVDPTPAELLAESKPQNQYQVPRNQAIARITNNPKLMKTAMQLVPRPALRFVRNKILLKKDAAKQPLDPAAADILKTAYKGEINQLAKLLNTPELVKEWGYSD